MADLPQYGTVNLPYMLSFLSRTQFRVSLAVAGLLLLATACSDKETIVSKPHSTTTTEVTAAKALMADDIAVAHTPKGGYGDAFPEPILAACTEPLVAGAPKLSGLWKTLRAERSGEPVPAGDRIYSHFQRVEQCGDRLIVTGGGVIHDMRVDGTEENGVNDVAEMDFKTKINVVATYEDGVHVLRPVGIPIEVTRKLDADGHTVWSYLGTTVTLERIGDASQAPPVA